MHSCSANFNADRHTLDSRQPRKNPDRLCTHVTKQKRHYKLLTKNLSKWSSSFFICGRKNPTIYAEKTAFTSAESGASILRVSRTELQA
ncbi:hypothetical protein JTB14_001758 [Gonioctena quinquepunctata]|nr:hypothetical protein JTB14_001758 [Gonioctena quinquepunctata]